MNGGCQFGGRGRRSGDDGRSGRLRELDIQGLKYLKALLLLLERLHDVGCARDKAGI